MPLTGTKLHLVKTLDDVFAFKEWLGNRRSHHAIAVDTETTGLKINDDIVRLLQIGDSEHGWAFSWDHAVKLGGTMIPGWGHAIMHELSRIWDGLFILHNAKFDVAMLKYMNVHLPLDQVVDTRIMAHCLEAHKFTGLGDVAQRLLGTGKLDFKNQIGTYTWETVPIDYQPYWTYGAVDAILTYKVYEKLWPQIQRECPKSFDLENKVSWTIMQMERYGAHIDVDHARSAYDKFVRVIGEIEEFVKADFGIAPGSNAKVAQALMAAGFDLPKTTATGAIALDKEVLAGINHPLANAVLRRRKLQKLASTYLVHFIDDVDSELLLHPSINSLGARTGRMSMSSPNLQNLPRRSETDQDATTVRRCVIPRSEDHTLVMCDFDQIEMRMLAAIADEKSMIDAFKQPEDFFTTLARMIFDDPSIEKKDPRRQIAKNCGYASIYGAGVEKFGITAGIPFEQAVQVKSRWDKMFPDVVRFQRKVIDTAIYRNETEGSPYVRCPITSRRQVADRGKEYSLVNYMVQGAAAAVFKMKLLELDAAGLGQWMVVPVHDEIVLDIPNEHVKEAVRILETIMNDDKMFSVPMSASVSHGRTWGDKQDWIWDE